MKKSTEIVRKSKKRSRSRSRKRLTKKKCLQHLQKKIAININEAKQGIFQSPKQAIAVAYSQIKKKYPSCKRYFKLKSKSRSRRVKKSK